jgi:hypothetical protein
LLFQIIVLAIRHATIVLTLDCTSLRLLCFSEFAIKSIFQEYERGYMIYYRIAVQEQQTTAWEWKSIFVKSLEALFQLGQQYDRMPEGQIRIFAASEAEYLDILLARMNLGLSTNSLTLEQLLHDHQKITAPYVCYFERELGWQEDADEQQSLFTLESVSEAAVELDLLPAGTLGRAVDADFALDLQPQSSDHGEPSSAAFSEFASQALVWTKLRIRVQAGEFLP